MAGEICKILKSKAKQHDLNLRRSSALIMGASFKENVKDIRNSKSIDLYKKLCRILNDVDIYDPILDYEKGQDKFPISNQIKKQKKFDKIILSVAHDIFSKINPVKFLSKNGFVFDIKSFYKRHPKIYRL